jgi:RHS repeat-associated protein
LSSQKERDVESQYDYFGARYYDSRIGRWLAVDPLAEKYPSWNPFTYVTDNPLRFTDARGDSVSLLTRGAGGSDWAGHPTSISMFGHAALNIDGKVYSYEGDGVLRVRDYNEYVNGETENVAPIVEQTLRVNQDKVQDALDPLVGDPGPYDRVSHSCTNLTMDVLAKGGIEFQEPNGAVTPLMLRNGLEGSDYVTNTVTKGSGLTLSSIGGQLMRSVALLLLDMGLSPMDRLSTKPILSGQKWPR